MLFKIIAKIDECPIEAQFPLIPDWVSFGTPIDAFVKLERLGVLRQSPFIPGQCVYNRLDLVEFDLVQYLILPESNYSRYPLLGQDSKIMGFRDEFRIGNHLVKPHHGRTFSSTDLVGGEGYFNLTQEQGVGVKSGMSTSIRISHILIHLELQWRCEGVVPLLFLSQDTEPHPKMGVQVRLGMVAIDGQDLLNLSGNLAQISFKDRFYLSKLFLLQSLDLLQIMHGLGILHTDLKEENILFGTAPGKLPGFWFVDFGLALYFKDPHLSVSGTYKASPLEQLYHIADRHGIDLVPSCNRLRPLMSSSDLYSAALVATTFLLGDGGPLIKDCSSQNRQDQLQYFLNFQLTVFNHPDCVRHYIFWRNPLLILQPDWYPLIDLLSHMLCVNMDARPSIEMILNSLSFLPEVPKDRLRFWDAVLNPKRAL